MIIECPSCHSKYQYDEDRFERKPSKKIRCAKCASIFEIQNPAFAEKTTPVAAVDGDSTFHRKEAPKPPETTAQSPIPKDEQRSTGKLSADLVMPQGRRLSLAIIEGPDAGSVYRIEKPRVTIGRANADLTLNDTEASRVHAAVEIRDLIYMLNDLGSTNGTLMEGRRIGEPTELQNQSEFQVGSTTLMFLVTEE